MIFEDGEQLRDFVNVSDIVQANLLAMDREEANGFALNIGSGQPITVRDVARTLAEELDSKTDLEITGKYRAGDIRHCYADISLARKVLGYSPRCGFRDGVAELVEWLRSQTAVDRVHEASRQLTSFGLTA
jgi:dTDP-L-rhamnose 4-epimerase